MIEALNTNLFYLLNSIAGESVALDAVIVFFAEGAGITIAFFALGWIIVKEKKLIGICKSAVFMFIVPAAAYIFSEILKAAFIEPRPFEVLPGVELLFNHTTGDAFPSGHAMTYTALAVAAYQYDHRLGRVLFIVVPLIALARVAAGVHWPVDIFAGALLGVAVALFFQIPSIRAFIQNTCEKIIGAYTKTQ